MANFPGAVMRNLECPICYSLLKEPKQLSCGHTFCEACVNCLLSAQTTETRRASISCPVCRQATAIGGQGVSSLPTNFPIKGIVSDVRIGAQHCSNCDSGSEADYYCSNCEHYLCRVCHDIHGKLRPNASHVVVSADDVKRGKVVPKRKVLCQEHKAGEGDECKDVCITCKKLICIRCMIKHDKQGHTVTSADEYKDSFSRDTESLRKKAEAKISNVMKHVKLVDAEKCKVVKHIDALSSKIKTTYKEAIKRLKEDKAALDIKCKAEKEKLCRELQEINIHDEHLVERLRNANSLVINSRQTPLEVDTVAIQEALCDQLTQVLGEDDPSSTSVQEVSDRVDKLTYEQDQELSRAKMGKVQYSEWIPKANVALSTADTLNCMTATPYGMMAVGCNKGGRGIEIYSADGQLQQRVLKGENIQGICFLSDGRCAVRGTGYTNEAILDVSLYTHGWEKADTKFETLSLDEGGHGDITVDSDDHIYVSHRNAKKIQVFTPRGGRPVREIICGGYEPSPTFAMKFSKMLVVRDFGNSARVINETGVKQYSLIKSTDTLLQPAVCKDDTILIATLNKEQDRVTIERYTSALQHMATLVTDLVIQKPTKPDNKWYCIQELKSGEIAFCTPDRLYILRESVKLVDG